MKVCKSLINLFLYSFNLPTSFQVVKCFSDPCQNGGACIEADDSSSYSCECVAGITGVNCETGKFSLCTECLLSLEYPFP